LSGCLGTSRSSSHGLPRCSSSTTPPRVGSSSTTSAPPRVRVPRHLAPLVTRLVAPLVVDYSASRRLVVDYFTSAARLGASARRAARHAARRAARRRLLRFCRASGCLGTSRGSSRYSSSTSPPRAGSSSTTPPRAGSSTTTPRRAGSSSTTLPRTGSSSTTSPTPRVRVPRHVARLTRPAALLVVDYFAFAARPGASPLRFPQREGYHEEPLASPNSPQRQIGSH
jgi:hypothetical protein